jgi:hypothetical protein
MSGTISFNPYTTTSPVNSFINPTQGYVSGLALDDPSARMWLMGGQLASSETVVMWGGVPISEEINNTGASSEGLGPLVKRATSQANTTGWSVFNQAASMVITPGNTVPVAAIGNYVSFFRNGTNIRICVNCDPALIAALTSGELINGATLYWDVTNYRITLTTSGNFALPTTVKLLSTNTNSKTVNYASASSITWTTGDAALILI